MSDGGPKETCVVCKYCPVKCGEIPDQVNGFWIDCPNCGRFEITHSARGRLSAEFEEHPERSARLSHAIRKMQQQTGRVLLNTNSVPLLIENTPLPKPQEQANNLVRWLGQNLAGFGDVLVLSPRKLVATIGGWSENNVSRLMDALKEQKILESGASAEGRRGFSLTMSGWDKFHELERGRTESRTAFMAMPYGDDRLDRVYKDCFKNAVSEAGFMLFRQDERPRAGIIDNRMRASIRTARFVVAELTGGNNGAYWEAGFAEGLDRPVIYTCERDKFTAAQTHFDTNHCHTVLWSESDLGEAAQQLTATIRATLPTEAILEKGE